MYSLEEAQKYWYEQRLGKVYGDLEVIAVWYNKEKRYQVWEMRCTKCGATRTINDPKSRKTYRCIPCRKNQTKYMKAKKSAEIKRAEEEIERRSHIGERHGSWEIIGCEKGKGYLTKCIICGTEKWRGYADALSHTAEGCTCNNHIRKYYTDDWNGKKVGHLTILSYQNRPTRGFVCKCDCGNTIIRKPTELLGKEKTYCGRKCPYYIEEVTSLNGESKTRIYRIFNGMRDRCYNPKNEGYYLYGGRGIRICDEWLNDFFAFKEWALTHGYKDDLSIERLDNDKGYEPSNCTWIPRNDQWINTHPAYTFKERKPLEKCLVEMDGEIKTKKEWCEKYGITVEAVRYRMKTQGITFEEAVKKPKKSSGGRNNSSKNQGIANQGVKILGGSIKGRRKN